MGRTQRFADRNGLSAHFKDHAGRQAFFGQKETDFSCERQMWAILRQSLTYDGMENRPLRRQCNLTGEVTALA
jgi:hypothetical protein